MDAILVINAGSSSIKLAVYDAALDLQISGQITEIGGSSVLTLEGESAPHPVSDHRAALSACLAAIAVRGISPTTLRAVAHRVVHGGQALCAPCRVTPGTQAQIEACIPLAPLHNPHNLSAMRAMTQIAPDVAQFASFDTAFHTTNPEVAQRYALPPEAEALGLRRYGFHGISYCGLVGQLPEISGAPLPARLLALHLGNGASLCAIRDGVSVATTMGYSPVSGLSMGTRSGDIDANAVLRLTDAQGIEGASTLLNRRSGLTGLGGASDMRALHADPAPEARFAIDHFTYWITRHAGSMIAAMGGLDGVAFTGGIGENDALVRGAVMQSLGWLGLVVDDAANAQNAAVLHRTGERVGAWIVPTREERTIAREALSAGA